MGAADEVETEALPDPVNITAGLPEPPVPGELLLPRLVQAAVHSAKIKISLDIFIIPFSP